MTLQMRSLRLPALTVAATLLGLAACGGDSGSGTGQLKLSVADAPVDGAQAVVVNFTGVELTGNGGNPATINFVQPKTIDLLSQSGTASVKRPARSMALCFSFKWT